MTQAGLKDIILSYRGCVYPISRVYANNLTYSFLPQFQKEVKFVSLLHGSQQSC